MVEQSSAQVYSEVYGILNSFGTVYINAIPKKLYNLINENRDKTFNPIYNMSIPLSQQNLSKKAIAFICMLHYKYWCTSVEEKIKIKKILKYNTEQDRNKYFEYEKKLNKNKSEISRDKPVKKDFNINENNTAIAVRKNDSIFKKIWNFFKHIFR